MNLGNLAKRIFTTICFTLMVVLAAGAAFAFGEGYQSYSLTIIKQLAPGSTENQAKQDYTFSVQVEGEDKPRIVTLNPSDPEKKEAVLGDLHDAAVTVTEVTDNITVDGSKLTAPVVESSLPVNGRFTTVNNSVEGGTITVKRNAAMRAEDTEDPSLIGTIVEPFPMKTWFKITQLDSSGDPKVGGHTETVAIDEGNSHSFTGLPRGLYQVEELKAEEGFYVTANDEIHVDAGKTQKVVLHGSSGKITIHAPGTEGDGHIHYFTIKGTDDWGNEFRNETIAVESAQNEVIDHLDAGTYEISEYEHPGNDAFSVTTSVTVPGAARSYTVPATGIYYSISDFQYPAYSYLTFRFGPSSGLPVGETYKMYLKGTWRDTGAQGAFYWTLASKGSNSSTDTATYNLNKQMNAGTFYVKVGEPDVFQNAALRVTPYTEKDQTYNFATSGVAHTAVVDSRGRLEVSKAADTSDHSEYIFSITGENNFNASFILHAGESRRFEGLSEGTYSVTETINKDTYDAFNLSVEDSELITEYSPNGELRGTIAGNAEITVTKMGNPNEDGGRVYTIQVGKQDEYGNWENFKTLTLKAGEKSSVAALDPGEYNARALDEFDAGYEVTYSGSSLHVGPSGGLVTFTNSYNNSLGAYRVIHEYYLEKDGKYSFEGSSDIATVNGLPLDQAKSASDVEPKFVFNKEEYTYKDSAYGLTDTPSDSSEPSLDSNGFVSKNVAKDSAGTSLAYSPVEGQSSVQTTEDGEQIIIMRYVRTEKPKANASYHVFHAYYLRTPQGDVFEGGSPHSSVYVGELNDDSHGYQYTSDGVLDRKGNKLENITDKDGNDLSNGVARVTKPTNFDVKGYHYTYTYGNTAYGYEDAEGSGEFFTEGTGHQNKDGQDTYIHLDDAMKCAYATEEGNQIIVLRYYRYPSGFYNVVHEYYVREKAQTSGEENSESLPDAEMPASIFELATQGTDDQSRILDQVLSAQSTPEQREAIQEAIDQFAGTLTPADEYEYYFEGNTDPEKAIGPLDEEVTNDSVEHRLQHEENEYTFLNAGYGQLSDGSYVASPEKASVVPTPEGDNLIILRYYRNGESIPDDEPEQSDNPSNPTTPADDGKQDPGDSLSKLGDYLPVGIAVAAVLAALAAFVAYRMKKRRA